MKIKRLCFGAIWAFPVVSSAATLDVAKADTNYYWSIDNSKFGGLKQQSRIEWSASPTIITLSDDMLMGEVGVFVGVDTNAKFIDGDWCGSKDGHRCTGGNSLAGGAKNIKWSGDAAKATMYRIGVSYTGDVYRFGKVVGLDSLTIENKSSLYADLYKAKGLYSDLYGYQKVGGSIASNKTQKYVFESTYGLRATKFLNGFVFSVMPFVGVHNMYMIDHHVLRTDTKNMRFTLLDTAVEYGAKLSVSHSFNGVIVAGGASYGVYKGFIAKALTRKGEGVKNVGIGVGDRGGKEASFFIKASYKF